MNIPGLVTGKEAAETVRRKARYGRKDWVLWRDRNNNLMGAPVTSEAVKAAMLDMGTKGSFTIYHYEKIGSMTPCLYRWRTGLIILRNLRRNEY